MPSGWSITTRGRPALDVQLSKLGDARNLEQPMREALKVLQQEASRWPPQPPRTRAKTFNTWYRERGRLPMSAFFQSRRVYGGRLYRKHFVTKVILKRSEMLLKKWKDARAEITHGGGYIVGRIRNAASYGQFVQGDRQARFHAATPWLTIEQIYRKHAARIQRIFEDAIVKLGK